MNRRRNQILMVCAAVFLAAFSGCGQETEPEKTEITLLHGWGTMENDHVAMRDIFTGFEEENPDIRLNLVSMPSSQEVIDKAKEMLSVYDIPDIIFAGGEGKDSCYRFMVEKNYALDFMPYLEKNKEFKKNVSPTILDYWTTEDGKLYTVSDVLILSGYWYNKEIFRKAGITELPETWEGFTQMCRKIQQWSQESTSAVAALDMEPETCFAILDMLLAGEGGSVSEKFFQYEIDVEDPGFTTALRKLKALYEIVDQDRGSYDYRDILSNFNEGKTAVYVNGVWADNMILPDIDAGYGAFPTQNGESVACKSSQLGYILGNTGDEKRMEASVRFVEYILSEETERRILLETGQIPSNPAVQIEDYKEEKPRLYEAVKAVDAARWKAESPFNLWEEGTLEIFKDRIAAYLSGRMEEKEFLDKLGGKSK